LSVATRTRFVEEMAAYTLRGASAAYSRGFLAAVGDWIARAAEDVQPSPAVYVPFQYGAMRPRVRNGIERLSPSKEDALYDVSGQAASLTPSHAAYRWRGESITAVKAEAVLKWGRPISRREFDRLRRAQS
jgi:hypothetical protein